MQRIKQSAVLAITAAIPALRPVVSDDYCDDEKLALEIERQMLCVEPVTAPPVEIPLHLDPEAQLPPWMPTTDETSADADGEDGEDGDDGEEVAEVPLWQTVLGAMAMSGPGGAVLTPNMTMGSGAWGMAHTVNMRGSVGMPIPGYPGYTPHTMRAGARPH